MSDKPGIDAKSLLTTQLEAIQSRLTGSKRTANEQYTLNAVNTELRRRAKQ